MYRFPEFKLADLPWLLWSASWNHLGTFSTPSTTWNPQSTCQLKITSAKSWASSTEVSLLYMKDNRRRAFPLWNRSPLFYYNVGEQPPSEVAHRYIEWHTLKRKEFHQLPLTFPFFFTMSFSYFAHMNITACSPYFRRKEEMKTPPEIDSSTYIYISFLCNKKGTIWMEWFDSQFKFFFDVIGTHTFPISLDRSAAYAL